MALILSIEAGTDVGSVALAEDGKLFSLRESGESRQHAQNLALYVEEILRENELEATDLDAVAVGKGPGSYTGLRICTSLAKGICYGAGIPLIAVGSLEALCCVAMEDVEAGVVDLDGLCAPTLIPMIDARRMEVYCQPFDLQVKPLAQVEAHIVTAESFMEARSRGEIVLFGDGAFKCKELLPESDRVRYVEVAPSARGLVRPAEEAFQAGRFEDIAYFEPLYLKDFLVTPSKKRIF